MKEWRMFKDDNSTRSKETQAHMGTIIIDSCWGKGEKRIPPKRRGKKAEKRTLDVESLSNFSCPSTPFTEVRFFSSRRFCCCWSFINVPVCRQFTTVACNGKENDVNHVSTSSLCCPRVPCVITHRVRIDLSLRFFVAAFSPKATKNFHTSCVQRQRHLIWTFGTERGS